MHKDQNCLNVLYHSSEPEAQLNHLNPVTKATNHKKLEKV